MFELILFGLAEVKPSPLIQTLTETQTVQVEPPPQELTIDEKIATNYYNCDESRQYIRADNANCLDRPQYRASETRENESHDTTQLSQKNTTTAPSGWFPKHQCTWHVWTKRPVGLWNDASDWLWQAKRDGYATGSTPQVGAIAWEYGHVSYVEAVDGDRVYISERNHDNKGSYRESWQPASKYQYIY